MNIGIRDNAQTKDSIISGALSLTIATITVKILGVLYKIPLASVLGDEGMGYFNSAYTVYSFFYLLCTAGVPKSVMILISEKLASGESEKINRIMKIAITAFLFLGTAVSLAFVIFAVPLAKMIGSSESYTTMICVAPSIIFASVAGVVRGYLNANMKMGAIAVSQILEGVVKLAAGLLLAIFAVNLGLSLPLISAFTIIGATLGSFVALIYLIIASKTQNFYLNSGQSVNGCNTKSVLKRIATISLPITVSAALTSLSGIIDLFLVMRRLEGIGYTAKEATALYGNYTTLAVSMFNLAVAVITPISIAFMPSLTRARTLKDSRAFDQSLKKALSFTSFITAPIVIGLLVYSKEILSFLFGKTAAETGAPLLVLLTPGIIFMSYLLIINSALESLGRPGLAMLSMIVGAAAKMIISGILLGNSDFGISGAPIGTVISYAISAFISLIIISYLLGYNIPVFSTSFIPYLSASVAVFGSRTVYECIYISMNSVSALLISIVVAAVIYFVLWGLYCLTANIKIASLTKIN